MLEAVDRAMRALREDDASGALATLLELWRRTPAPELADAIDRVGARVVGDVAAIAGKDRDARQRWDETAIANHPDDLSRLCATLLDVAPPVAARRVKLLARRTPDPRLAVALARHIKAPPFKTSTAARFYRLALDVIDKLGDVRALDLLPSTPVPVNARGRTSADITLEVHLPGVRDHLTAIEPPAIPLEISEWLAALQPTAPVASPRPPADPRDLDALLDAVYGDLASDEARLVLADALQEVGDPRGELIALQIERSRRGIQRAGRAEAALVKAHGRAWMGELADFIHTRDWSYRRGFLAACRVESDRALPRSRLWATVEELHFRGASGRGGHVIELLLGLPSLRRLSGIGAEVAAAITTAEQPPQLESLSFGTIPHFFGDRDFDRVVRQLASTACGLRLRRLALIWWRVDREAVRTLLESQAGASLEQLVVCGRPRNLAEWLDAIGDRGPALRSIELRSDGHLDDDLTGYRLVVHRTTGRFTTVDAIGPYREQGPRNSAMAANASLAAIAPAVTPLGLELRLRTRRDDAAG